MKLFKLATPWDYHEQSALIIMAEDRDDALKKLLSWASKEPFILGGFKAYVEEAVKNPLLIIELESDVYEDYGCDC